MTKNDRHALVILGLIVVVSLATLFSKNLLITMHASSVKQERVNITENLVNEQETASTEYQTTDTIETTMQSETTNIDETTQASYVPATNSNNVVDPEANAPATDTHIEVAPAEAKVNYTSLPQYNQALLEAINSARASYGLSAVYLDSRLTSDAVIRANEEANDQELNHTRPDGNECFYVDKGYYTAEILYRGNSTDATRIVEAWLNSPNHRDIIIDANYPHKACGIAMVAGSDGLYYCCIGFN